MLTFPCNLWWDWHELDLDPGRHSWIVVCFNWKATLEGLLPDGKLNYFAALLGGW